MTFQEVASGNVFVVGDNFGCAIVVHADEGDDLVERTFGVQLNLAVLIGNAQRFCGGLTCVYGFAVEIDCFTKRFRPDLAIEVCHIFKTVGIGHQNADVLAALHLFVLHERAEKSGVLSHVFDSRSLAHFGCAFKHSLDIDAHNGKRHKTYGAENGESSAYAGLNRIMLEAFGFSEVVKRAFSVRSGDDDMLFSLFLAERLFKQIVHDEELA